MSYRLVIECDICNIQRELKYYWENSNTCIKCWGKWCKICNKEYSNHSKLIRHLWGVHNIGNGKYFKCTEENCNYKCKANESLKKHLWQVHNKGNGEWFNCTEENCDYKCKSNSDLKKHLREVHNKGNSEWFNCTEENCNYKCKRNSNLKQHLWQVHSVGNAKYFECTEEKCDYKCKNKGDLKKHLWQVHNKGNGKYFSCTEENCKYKCKSNSDLKKHLSNIHDIGTHTCEICLKNCFKLTKYYDKKDINICRNCYRKYTGYSSRPEKDMIEYLQSISEISPYIVLHDSVIKGDSCMTKRRPDLLISSSNELNIFVECDENQHSGYDSNCESGRIDEILDEVKDSRTIFIRWNPDNYNKKPKKSRKERLEQLKDYIIQLTQKKNWSKDFIIVHYMFYNEDNEVVSTRHSKTFVY
jgi:ATP-dependent Clp protease adapter protein ClpS